MLQAASPTAHVLDMNAPPLLHRWAMPCGVANVCINFYVLVMCVSYDECLIEIVPIITTIMIAGCATLFLVLLLLPTY
jgi:hypothetical protein